MTLFIEYVILDNMTIDYLLLSLVGVVSKDNLKFYRKIIACIVGTLFAIFLPYIAKFRMIAIVYKLVCALLMILILKKHKSFRNYLKDLLMLLFFTFLFGGVLIGILTMLNIEYTTTGFILYNFELPIGVFLIIFYIGFWLLRKIINALNRQLKLNNFTYNIKLIDNANVVQGIGYFDSGNMICKNGQAVNIISSELFFKLYQNYTIDKLLFRNIDHSQLKDASYIEIKSLSKGGKYLTFMIDKFIVEDKEYSNVYVAVALKKFENFDCIINSKIVGGCI